MRTVLLLASMLLARTAIPQPRLTCPDLSGRYVIQGEDGRVRVTIHQTACSRLTVEWVIGPHGGRDASRHELHLDSQPHPDGGWFGERTGHRTSAEFRGDTLEIVARSADPHHDVIDWQQRFTLLPDRDLCTMFVRRDTSWSRAAQLADGRDAESVAALRSATGCPDRSRRGARPDDR